MRVTFTHSFIEDLLELTSKLQRKCLKRIEELNKIGADRLFSNELPAGWNLEKLKTSSLWSLHLDQSRRIILSIEGDWMTLRRVGPHDVVYSRRAIQNDKGRTFAEFSGSADEVRAMSTSSRSWAASKIEQTRLPDELRGRIVEQLELGKIAEEDKFKLLTLDDEQLHCIDDFLAHNPRALVVGGAGTGKTLIAVEVAKRSANAGKRVLYICFTEALAHFLKSQAAPRIDIWPIKRFAVWLLECAERGIDVPRRREDWTPAFWQSVVPRVLQEAQDAVRMANFDTIVVDEGQDLDADDWNLIEQLCQGDAPARLAVFCDPSQRLWLDRQMPTTGFARYSLSKQYRCHEEIQDLASRYQIEARQELASPARRAERGVAPRRRVAVLPCPNRNDVPHAVAQEIERCLAQGLRPSDIAVISLVSRTVPSSLAGLDELERHTLVRANDARVKNEIVAESVYRFKGLERPVAIVTDLSLRGEEDETIRRAKMNVAITRAQSFLRIIDTREAILREPELSGLCP